jgi:predicted DsbA family dithiol-disulfide isomerase
MAKMQVFYDYECPFCKKGYEALIQQLDKHPEIEIEWRPIESHPLPEDHPPHTYLAGQCYYIAKELGADTPSFHAAMYQAAAVERQNVEKADVLCNILKDIVDGGKLRAMLESGRYAKQIDENNDLAYEKEGVWFVPAFRMNGKKLDAKGGIGVSSREFADFLS